MTSKARFVRHGSRPGLDDEDLFSPTSKDRSHHIHVDNFISRVSSMFYRCKHRPIPIFFPVCA